MLNKLIESAALYIVTATNAKSNVIDCAFWYGNFLATMEAIELIDSDYANALHNLYKENKRICCECLKMGKKIKS